MTGCCDPRGCDAMFSATYARHDARRYRRRGLDRTGAAIVAFCAEQGLDGATVLEVGGGLGTLSLELVRAGAASATVTELSPGYDEAAAELLAEAGLAGRVRRRILDVAATPEAVEPADIVVLHRVVCCYPDYSALLTAAAGRSRRLLVFSFPRAGLPVRALVAAANGVFSLRGRQYRTFVHAPEAMFGVLERQGLAPDRVHRGAVWQVAGATRR